VAGLLVRGSSRPRKAVGNNAKTDRRGPAIDRRSTRVERARPRPEVSADYRPGGFIHTDGFKRVDPPMQPRREFRSFPAGDRRLWLVRNCDFGTASVVGAKTSATHR